MPSLGATEILLILLVVVLLFGAKKLPELARGSGRALRIFKTETTGLIDSDKDKDEDDKPVTRADELTEGTQARVVDPIDDATRRDQTP